jgi:hypothetical protein
MIYLVFGYDQYYPNGGMNDFIKSFPELELAREFVNSAEKNKSGESSHWLKKRHRELEIDYPEHKYEDVDIYDFYQIVGINEKFEVVFEEELGIEGRYD